jgi:hypothetical protein
VHKNQYSNRIRQIISRIGKASGRPVRYLGIVNRLLSIIASCLITAALGAAQDSARFIGAWRLAWIEQPGPDGKPHRVDSSGMLVFTRDGHMSVQVMERHATPRAAGGPEQYSQGGYEASYGSYRIDEHARTFTFHVEGALVRDLIGKDLPRAYELSGKLLMVKSARPDEHWRVAWEHY